ncbi:MAG: hypothetical protein HFF53_11935 [Lawsonibacter sp.]|nr:hypothetical protein [Lawsonibacter sp.]
MNGDVNTFRNECAYYWVVDARAHNRGAEQEDEMDQEKFNRMFEAAMG